MRQSKLHLLVLLLPLLAAVTVQAALVGNPRQGLSGAVAWSPSGPSLGNPEVMPESAVAAGEPAAGSTETFVFDADGNMVSAVAGADETRYLWSPDNRLLAVEKDIDCPRHHHGHCRCPQQVVERESYGYLPNDWRRVTRTVGGETFVSLYEGEDESHEYLVKAGGRDGCGDRDDRDGGHGMCSMCRRERKHCHCPTPPKLELVREYVGGPAADDLVATRWRGRELGMLGDALGSTIVLVNRGGHAVARVGYDAWGVMRWPDKPGHGSSPCGEKDLGDYLDRCEGGRSFGGPGLDGWHLGRHQARVLTPYLYTGRRWEPIGANYWHRNRYYNPASGRFVSRDPIQFEGGYNLWGYAACNPLSISDPSGLELNIAVRTIDRLGYGKLALEIEALREQLPAKWPALLDLFRTKIRNHVNLDVRAVYREIIHWGHQVKHQGSPTDGRSVITADPVGMLDAVTGILGTPPGKEWCDYSPEIIGVHKKVDSSCPQDTTRATVHFSKLGLHFVPAAPSDQTPVPSPP